MQKSISLHLLLPFILLAIVNSAFAQPSWTINLLDSSKRSKKFEERKLGSEKMAEKKFTKVRHVFQNNYTHYNYYYNANNKINAVIERAKAGQKDDYTKLLSYYPYNLESTAAQKTELDSVIYKATAGILLHDLRNDWIDNMYLLMGQAYFYRKDFDSAAATFQFINYNLFPRKKDEDDSRVVGTRTDDAVNSSLSIANKEKRNILQKLTALPPSRNDALIWMARTLTEQNELYDAASLISTLQHDPNVPERLVNDLAEVNAYWFYKQNIFDSSATYLEAALSNAPSKADRARQEFLLAQLYEMTRQYDKATDYYNKASKNTTDPLMDIYAQLNNAKMLRGTDAIEMQKNINNLVHMAKKDRFEPYRDIIFYSAGDLSMKVPDTTQAVFYYNKSIGYNEANIHFKNMAFLKLANIAYDRRQYKLSFAMYDSLQTGDTALNDQLIQIQERRNALSKIVEKIIVIEREDSLQKVAAMPEAERVSFVKKIAKQLRKERGIKGGEEMDNGSVPISFDSKKNEAVDLFSSNDSKGEWYFNNAALKSRGVGEFKRKWGTRANADNWRRKSASEGMANNGITSPPDMASSDLDAAPGSLTAPTATVAAKGKAGLEPVQAQDISMEGLLANLPLTPEKLTQSNTLVAENTFELAQLYQTELEDYQQAIVTYDESLRRFPDSLYDGALYLGLYYCYNKLGITDRAAYYKNLINSKFAGSRSNKLLTNPVAAKPGEKNAEGTKRYADIYNLFIEGNFDKALTEKKKADSLYGNNYWSPQLLYIEAVYHIKQHKDSIATDVLNDIMSLYAKSPLAAKAERMIDVLKRRKEIESYLTALQVTRVADDEVTQLPMDKLIRDDNNLIVTPKRFDSSKAITPPKLPGVAVNMEPKGLPVVPVVEDTVKKVAPVVVAKDSIKKVPQIAVVAKDSIKKVAQILTNGPFSFITTQPQNVVMVLDKVDGTYVNESKNAFIRYVGENFKGQQITIAKDALDKDIALLVFTAFENADAALQFLNKVKKAAPDEVSWLPAAKYSFIIISDDNLSLLRANKNLKDYKGLLNKQYPGKF